MKSKSIAMNYRIKISLLSVLSLSSLNFYSQQDTNQCRLLINGAATFIYQAQKEMLAAQKNNLNGLLAKAFILQMNAVNEYKNKNYSISYCYSVQAKKNAIEIIRTLKGNENQDASLQKEDNSYSVNCMNDIEMYREAKSNLINASEKDIDYLTVENRTNKIIAE